MRCWNCLHELPATARRCPHCEAAVVDQPGADELAAAREIFEMLPPEALTELQRFAARSETAEEFADSILVGDCPKCESSQTGNCENDPEIGELLVGRCFECGYLWCTMCDQPLQPGKTVCECWDEDWGDEFEDEEFAEDE